MASEAKWKKGRLSEPEGSYFTNLELNLRLPRRKYNLRCNSNVFSEISFPQTVAKFFPDIFSYPVS